MFGLHYDESIYEHIGMVPFSPFGSLRLIPLCWMLKSAGCFSFSLFSIKFSFVRTGLLSSISLPIYGMVELVDWFMEWMDG